MAKNDITNNENILVKVDQNNLVFVDPNSVLDGGVVKPRGSNQENLVFYLNLEADLVPRTVLNSENGGGGRLESIARGTLNMLQNKNGDYLDTSWTDVYTNQPLKDGETYISNSDASGQSFGISSASIEIKGANFIPYVNITFIDVRGKTLFESPKNSPYKAFFHLPWPIFYLTVKGFYGKAIRYRLHMVSFNTSYNESNGNFESNAKFVGSTYAYLNDISLTSILNAPYMYGIELPVQEKINDDESQKTVKLSKSSRGYQTLVSVYDEYRRKGLITIPENQNPTLREVIAKARRLDQILEDQIFGEKGIVDMKLFGLVKEFDDILLKLYGEVKSWETTKLSKEIYRDPDTQIVYYYLIKTETDTSSIVGQKGGCLELILSNGKKEIEKIQKAIRELLSKSTKEFKTFNVNIKNPIKSIDNYYIPDLNGKIGVTTPKILDEINDIIKSFNEEKKKLQDKVEEEMNNIIVTNGNYGLGFEPTIRNVFGVLLAGADTYVRLMNSVHFKAYNARDERADLLVGFSDESTSEGAVYPWPEVKKQSADNRKVLAYPGDSDLVRQLNSDNATLWPEIEFVEEFMAVSQKITDNLAEKERTFDNVTYTFENTDADQSEVRKTSMINILNQTDPYSDKTFAAILYEIFERIRYSTLFETFNRDTTLHDLAIKEFKTLQELIKEDYYLVDILREVNGVPKMEEYLESFSPFERYPYYQDGLPTTPYIKDIIASPFSLKKSTASYRDYSQEYEKLSSNLLNYEVEEYRLNIYPFNSTTYLGYQYKTSVTKNDMSLRDIYKVDTSAGFVTTYADGKAWVNEQDQTNIFSLSSYYGIGDNLSSVFNTPYFHSTLYQDFFKTSSYGKYKSSAYLVLNSLPFKDLDQDITLNGKTAKISNIFKEVGATHHIPYHLILKWGSIYHRYKTYITEGVDIVNNVTTPINGAVAFDGGQNLTYSGITRSTQDKVGIYPFYSSIYHQVINDYLYYDVNDTTPTSFENSITNNVIHIDNFKLGDITYYNSFVDNSRFDVEDKRYTILPSHGSKLRVSNTTGNYPYSTDFLISEQFNFNVDWVETKYDEFSYSGVTFPSYNQYLTKNLNNRDNQIIDISNNNKKVIDLIATFSPQILQSFEEAFLKFSSERVDTYETIQQFKGVKYDNFQNLLKGLLTVEKSDDDDLTEVQTVVRSIHARQLKKQETITTSILSSDNLIELTMVNPKELDLGVLFNYVGTSINERSSDGTYDISQNANNSKYIELYVGEDIDGFYSEFFSLSNIELNEDNVIDYRFLLHIYAGWRQLGNAASKTEFIQYVSDNIIGPHKTREAYYSLILFSKMSSLERSKDKNNNLGILKTFGQEPLKLEMYNNFKLFNDRWTSGNSIGQRLLMEEFLFLDKANRDIGDTLFFDVKKLIVLGEPESSNLRLYGAISSLLARNNLDLRALPAYVNFYGNETNKTKIKPSSSVASLLFGKFLDVDIEHSTPKMIVQYVGKPSYHIDTSSISTDYKYKDDSFNLEDANNNPLLITDPNYFENQNFKNSNKVVAFEVSFGDQNQGIFKGISLDQSQFKSTFESMSETENLARSESGSGISQVDTALFDIYKVRSYTCQVRCMGNVMIQPTMYFQLKNVPLFKGSYWIVEVSHSIQNNTIETMFTGVRIPKDQLPDPKESFTASYRILYDKIMNSAIKKIESVSAETTDEIITTNEGTFKTNRGNVIIDGEKLVKEVGVDDYGIPYNGYGNKKSIQKITYKGNTWYRTYVSRFDGPTSSNMVLPTLSKELTVNPTKLPFTELQQNSSYYYRLGFDGETLSKPFKGVGSVADELLIRATSDFLNPVDGRTKTFSHQTNLNSTSGNRYIQGPADIGSSTLTSGDITLDSGIAMSPALMKDLRLKEGDVVYFKIR